MTSTVSRLPGAVLLAALCLLFPVRHVAAQSTGSITGQVTDARTGAPLVGADVLLDGTPHVTATDRTGSFRLAGVAAGDYALVVLYLGHADQRARVTVTAGRSLPVEIQMPSAQFTERVQVSAEPIGEGQARALNQQHTAPNITNVVSSDQIGSFPDPNAAEAASRIPGVSIARDQGEGRYILIRGTEARLNSVLIDGERIPAPESDTRQVQLDAVPADQLQAIEVSKAVTPDMDADAIGGAVNLVTRQAVSRPTMLFSASGGYNALQESADQRLFSGTVGRRFAGGTVGGLLSGSSSNLTRGSENFEAEYDDGDLDDLQLRDYQIERNRYGLNASVDVKPSDSASFIFRTIVNRFEDYERNNRTRYRPGNSRIEYVMKNRHQNDNIRSVSGAGQHVLTGAGGTLDYKVSWAESSEDQPDRLDTIFRLSGVSFAPNVSAGSIDPENIQPNPSRTDQQNAKLNAWETEIFTATDRDVVAQANLRWPLRTGTRSTSVLKVGAKVRDKRKVVDFQAGAASPPSTVLFSQLQDASFKNDDFLSFFPARYPAFLGIDADASRAMFNGVRGSEFEVDPEGDASNYDASETVTAGYAMAEIFLGDKLYLLPGLRYESTKVDYTGYEVLYDDGGDYVSTEPRTGGDTYGFLLPGLHLRYAIDQQTNVRAAYTRTLARPNYYDLVPYQLVFQEDGDIERGNPALKPTTSDNLDFMVEHYLASVGVVSGGVFYKKLHDYIYPFRYAEVNFGETYRVSQPLNGDAASLWGMEVAFQNQFRGLPAPFDGLGVYANYTWSDSSATFPDRDVEATLPGQSTHIGNLALWYEKHGFSARASWNFHGKYIDEVGGDASEDVYYDNHTQLDVSLSQRLTRNLRLYTDVLNLTNAPLRYYIGETNRPIQQEYYRWWMMFGLKANF
ncbi:MAG: TonB-dependent receptor [Vicinamibacterales bacterium]